MEMDKKQSTLLILTIAAFGFLSYQMYRLVNDDLTETPVHVTARARPTKSIVVATTKPVKQAVEIAEKEDAPLSKSTKAKMAAVAKSISPLARDEKVYLNLVDQYQLARMERQLLDEKAAIAQARNRIAMLNKKTAELDGTITPISESTTQHGHGIQNKIANYTLSYLDKQNNSWSATLFRDGQYQEVMPGSRLDKGIVVAQISHKGVLLQKGRLREWITFNGIEAIAPTPSFAARKLQNAMAALNPRVNVLAKAKTQPKAAKKEKKVVVATNQPLATSTKMRSVLGQQFAARETAILNITPKKLLTNKTKATTVKKTKNIAKPNQDLDTANIKHFATVAREIPLLPQYWQQQTIQKAALSKPAATNSLQVNSKIKTNVTAVTTLAENEKTKPKATANEQSERVKLAIKMPRYSPDEQHLMTMSHHDYTIELIASYHETVISNFDRANDLGKNVNEYYVFNDGKKWHMLLFGDYKSYEQAQAALNGLPANLKAEGPWIRQVADVQRDLRGRLQA